jgi:uncharacterized protein YkwD
MTVPELNRISVISAFFLLAPVVVLGVRPESGVVAAADCDDKERGPSRGTDLEQVRETLLELHNQARAEVRLPSLAVNKKLEAAADGHARDMAKRHTMTHTGEDGSSPTSRILAQGYPLKRCGENVAFGRYTLEKLMKGWIESPPHKANIFGNFSQIGVGYAVAEDGTAFWCVTFGLPLRRK